MKDIGIDELATFCKRKGFVYPSGEIYGGLTGFWDFGPLGVELKGNLKREWWKYNVNSRDDMAGIDGAIITNPKVWKASGHVDSFVDVAVVNKKTGEKFKVDKHEVKNYEGKKEFEIKGEFNPMFVTFVGPVRGDAIEAYLRPETAQLIFADFKQVWDNARMKLPGGIAQVGKSFRNEISPREFLFRLREFEQMEIEYFIEHGMGCPYMDEIKDVEILVLSEEDQKEGKDGKTVKVIEAVKKGIFKKDWHAYWISKQFLWFTRLGANKDKFRARQHTSEERSHYASDTWDLEYQFPMGWRELQGFADRSNYDLTQHEKFSKKSLEIVHDNKKVLPEVVCEPSLGVERAFLVFMFDSYNFDEKRNNIVLKLHPKLAPYKAAVLPIVKNDEKVVGMSKKVLESLRGDWNVLYDESGSLGRRYSRNDEIGTPLCITIDKESLEDNCVTIRDRDTTKQVRVKIEELNEIVSKVVRGERVLNFGKLVETRVKD